MRNAIIASLEAAIKVLSASQIPQSLLGLKPEIAKAAQKVYDGWDASDETYGDWQVGFGGVCHLIADAVVDVLSDAGIAATTVSSNHEVHVYVVAQTPEGVFEIDIRPSVYETGGGYSWKKIPDVEFEPGDIDITMLSPSPKDIRDFVEEWEDEED